MSPRRIGILGGTFDPIHRGHVDAAQAAESALGLSEVLFVPANIPPHRPQPLASNYHRFAMVALAIAGRDGWRASDLELLSGATSFTTDTLRRMHERGYASTELFFIIGADAFAEIDSWKDFPAILDQANFAVVSRPRWPVADLPARLPSIAPRMTGDVTAPAGPSALIFLIDAPTADVSSTAIRQDLAAGRPFSDAVPPAVHQYMKQQELYTIPGDHAGQRTPVAGRMHGQN